MKRPAPKQEQPRPVSTLVVHLPGGGEVRVDAETRALAIRELLKATEGGK